MSVLSTLRSRLPERERLAPLLATVTVTGMVVGYLLFTSLAILPQARAWRQLTLHLDAAQRAAAEAQTADEQSPEIWRKRLEAAEGRRAVAASVLLSEAQAADAISRLYGYAAECGVEIGSLQGQKDNGADTGSPGKIHLYRLQATGQFLKLALFVTHIREASLPAFRLTNMGIRSGKGKAAAELSVDVVLYTSPYAPAQTLPGPGAPPPTLTALDPRPIERALTEAWNAGDWPQALGLLAQIGSLEPAYPALVDKTYTANVNYGYRLLLAGDTAGAVSAFKAALQVKASGTEAAEGLERALHPATPMPPATQTTAPTAAPAMPTVLAPTAAPAPATYTVVAGDTLYSLARRFGTTVQALMAANNLASEDIRAGQQLSIPAS